MLVHSSVHGGAAAGFEIKLFLVVDFPCAGTTIK
jgi:hypothetical protein